MIQAWLHEIFDGNIRNIKVFKEKKNRIYLKSSHSWILKIFNFTTENWK